jgi:hypothetical protein
MTATAMTRAAFDILVTRLQHGEKVKGYALTTLESGKVALRFQLDDGTVAGFLTEDSFE